MAVTIMLALSACGEKKEEAASEGASTATSTASSPLIGRYRLGNPWIGSSCTRAFL